MQKSKLDQFFSIPAAAVLMAVVCNVLWGSAFPFIKLGYRLFAIDSADTASILCFVGVKNVRHALASCGARLTR